MTLRALKEDNRHSPNRDLSDSIQTLKLKDSAVDLGFLRSFGFDVVGVKLSCRVMA